MRPSFPAVVLGALAVLGGFARAQMQSSAPLQSFQGATSQSTASFTVPDAWEVRWSSGQTLNISVLAPDGSLVAGAITRRGALFVAKGGTYRLQIDVDGPTSAPPTPSDGPSGFQNTINGGMRGDANGGASPSPNPNFDRFSRAYTVEVVQMNSPAAQGPSVTPNFKMPAGAATAGGVASTLSSNAAAPGMPAPPAPTAGKLTENQARAVVLIKGDKAEGTGFLVKSPEGPVVVTNIHVIADNPNLKVTTSTGALVTVLSQKCASDRDLAMLAIQDNGYSYLEMAPDISAVVQPGDEVITPGNSQGGEVMLNTAGKVLGIGPERIEIDNPIYHGNSGGPVFHTKSGKVLGVVTEAMKVDMSNELDKTSFANRNSAISNSMRYFALRLDTVVEWVSVDPRAFHSETAFLDQFEDQSRRLDAYLNRADNSGGGRASSTSSDVANIYLDDDRIMRAEHNYQSQSSGGDTAQRLEALRSLLFDLQGVADLNVSSIQSLNNFYPFDRERAREEMSYRQALKSELDSIAGNIERLGHLPRSNN